jgi:peptide/nickel transport system ATP-binding protein
MSTMPEAAPVLSVDDLRAYYVTDTFGVEREVRAVDGVSFKVHRNEIYGLAGESSSGKTTLIKTVAAAVRPPLRVVSGAVTFHFAGRELNIVGASAQALARVRWKHLSYIMQSSMNVLNPVRRVKHSFVDFAFRHMGKLMPEFLDSVRLHLERLHLDAEVLGAYPHQLSGGMRQRVAIALATVCQPDFIIADEPTTALDVIVQKDVLTMIKDIQRAIRSSLLFVTHDLAVHAHLADRLGIMYAGRLVEEAKTGEIFRAPRHPYTVHLVSTVPRIGQVASMRGLEGTPPHLADPPTGCRFHPRCSLATDICRRKSPPMTQLSANHRVACFAATSESAR